MISLNLNNHNYRASHNVYNLDLMISSAYKRLKAFQLTLLLHLYLYSTKRAVYMPPLKVGNKSCCNAFSTIFFKTNAHLHTHTHTHSMPALTQTIALGAKKN